MRILHIITGLNNGGAEAVLARLIEVDAEFNQHFVISLMNPGISAARVEKYSVGVYYLNFSRGKILILGVLKLFRLILKIRPDVVQTWLYHADFIGGIIAYLAGIRFIVWGVRHANLDPRHNKKSTLLIVRLCAILSYFIPRTIISCSEEGTRLHQDAGYQAHKFIQIPNGYDMNRFKPDSSLRDSIRTEFSVNVDAFVFGMVGRFDVQKDHKNLVTALGQLKSLGIDFTCFLIGVDMNENNALLCNWIEKAGISNNIKLLGSRVDIPAVMNALDVFVLSSLGEAFPNVLAEAMACGTPCVTTDVGDASVIVSTHGWVVKRQDPSALAKGLIQAYESFKKPGVSWSARQSACRAHIMSNFDLEIMRKKYCQTWSNCIANEKR